MSSTAATGCAPTATARARCCCRPGASSVDLSLAATVPTRSRDNDARHGMPDLPPTVEVGPNLNIALLRSADGAARLDLRLPLRSAIALQRSPRSVGVTFSPNLNLDLDRVARRLARRAARRPALCRPALSRALLRRRRGLCDRRTGRPTGRRGGYAGWRALASTSRRIGKTWVGAFVRYDNLNGAAFADSPLVRRHDALTVGFGVSWVLATLEPHGRGRAIERPRRAALAPRCAALVALHAAAAAAAARADVAGLESRRDRCCYPLLPSRLGTALGRAAIARGYRDVLGERAPPAACCASTRRRSTRCATSRGLIIVGQPPEHARRADGGRAAAAQRLHHEGRADAQHLPRRRRAAGALHPQRLAARDDPQLRSTTCATAASW